ncbi:cytochrome c oxidase accessory protein CcoG [Phenylobacterium sp. LjRoot219]|uniref:cytochrome c oxidase accessory protein CcoG n=1 Tax=Phenylobacterium sp. LjRoot219 TaxID=3342283 RepID=UPI003ECC364F
MTVVIDRRTPPPDPERGPAPVSAAERLRAKEKAGGLYKPRVPIYPKLVHGRWRAIKWALLIVTLSIYYVTPWLRWARPEGLPQQAVLVDLAHWRFYFFFIQLWPQEVYFFTGLLVIAALALFLTTALFGRLWCGYTCPQTVWTDLYIYVERLFEGDRNARMRLDAEPMSFNKLWRKAGKHLVWLGVAFGTGGAWIFYFHDAPDLLRDFWAGQAPVSAYLSCGVLTATTYLLAGFMREQVCTYMCPWPRIQGAMLDQHSLQVTYRSDRGEPRGAHKKRQSWAGRGDCIDCRQCVVACPMGIDIRNGPQMECINCGLCIDACDEIMLRVERPRGLIAYDTDAAVAARAAGQKPIYRLVRPRTLYYAAALALVAGLTGWGLATRTALDVHVLRDRNPTFVRLRDGSVRNGYTLKIANRSFQAKTIAVRFEGAPGAQLKPVGAAAVTGSAQIIAPANAVRTARVFVVAPPPFHARDLPSAFVLRDGATEVRAETLFITGAEVP